MMYELLQTATSCWLWPSEIMWLRSLCSWKIGKMQLLLSFLFQSPNESKVNRPSTTQQYYARTRSGKGSSYRLLNPQSCTLRSPFRTSLYLHPVPVAAEPNSERCELNVSPTTRGRSVAPLTIHDSRTILELRASKMSFFSWHSELAYASYYIILWPHHPWWKLS